MSPYKIRVLNTRRLCQLFLKYRLKTRIYNALTLLCQRCIDVHCVSFSDVIVGVRNLVVSTIATVVVASRTIFSYIVIK